MKGREDYRNKMETSHCHTFSTDYRMVWLLSAKTGHCLRLTHKVPSVEEAMVIPSWVTMYRDPKRHEWRDIFPDFHD
jgi:hypothetical protein